MKLFVYFLPFLLIVSCNVEKRIDRIYMNAHELARDGKPRKASEYLEDNIAEENRDDKYYFYHGSYLEMDDPRYNIHSYFADFQKAYQLNPNKYMVVYSLGSAYFGLADFSNAEKYLKEAVELYDGSSPQLNPYSLLGSTYIQLEQYDMALTATQKALKEYDNDAWDIMNRGIASGEMGDIGKMRKDYELAIELDPQNIMLHNAYGNRLIKLGYYDKAQDFYEKLLEAHYHYWFAHADLGYLKLLNGDLEGARVLFNRSLKISSQDPATLAYYSYYYYLKKNYPQAFKYQQRYRIRMEKGLAIELLDSKEKYVEYFKSDPLFERLLVPVQSKNSSTEETPENKTNCEKPG